MEFYIYKLFHLLCPSGSSRSQTREVLGIEKLSDDSFSFPSLPLQNYTYGSFSLVWKYCILTDLSGQKNIACSVYSTCVEKSLHTCFLTKCCFQLIFKPSIPFLLISFTLFTLFNLSVTCSLLEAFGMHLTRNRPFHFS